MVKITHKGSRVSHRIGKLAIMSQDCIDAALKRGETAPNIVSDELWKQYAFNPAVIRMINMGKITVEHEEPKPEVKPKQAKVSKKEQPEMAVDGKEGE